MQQIADWLEKLGMSEYAQRFAENSIDFSVLRRPDRSGPQGIGVALGHRRKMLAAIAELARCRPRTARSLPLHRQPQTPKTQPSAAKSR